MTAEIQTFPEPQKLADYINDLYGGGSTSVTVTLLKPSVYLIQHD
jgi:hypothetical protein